MRVDADSGGDGEIAGGGFAGEILIFDAAESDAADCSGDGDTGGGAGAQRDSEVMGKSVGGAERQNGERDRRAGQALNDIMDRAVAAAGEDGVAAGGDCAARVIGRLLAGEANCKIGVHSGRLDDADGVVQFHVALSSPAARVGIEQDSGFAHVVNWLGLV